MHNWSDDSVDWRGINDAAQFIATQLVRWGRMGVRDYKEKWGTVRVYVDPGWSSLHSITHPQHMYSRYPGWLWRLCCGRFNSRVFSLINRVIVPYHCWLYAHTYKRALRKWPHLRREILSAADHKKLLLDCGIHYVRMSENMYTVYIDWAPGEPERNVDEKETEEN